MNNIQHLATDKPDRLCPMRETASIVSLSKSSIYQMIAGGRFPAPIKLSPKRVAWSFNDLQDWIADRKVAA